MLEPRNGGAAIAVKPQEVAHHVHELVKLTADEFLQVVLLAQGRFQEFLLARSDTRLALLTTLFDIGRFTDYTELLEQRRRDLAGQRAAARTGVDTRIARLLDDGDDAPAAGCELDWLDQRVTASETDTSWQSERRDEASRRHDAARRRLETAERQRERADSVARLAELESRAGEIAIDKARLAAAERAARVRPLAEAAGEATKTLAAAENDLTRAMSAYAGDAPDDPSAEAERLTEVIGVLQPLVDVERRLSDDDRTLETARTTAAGITARLQELADRRHDLDQRRRAAAETAAGGDHARRLLDEVVDLLAAARTTDDLAARRVTAQEVELQAGRALEDATRTANELLDRYLHGQAAVLAGTLHDGEQCPVCGSTDHPARRGGRARRSATPTSSAPERCRRTPMGRPERHGRRSPPSTPGSVSCADAPVAAAPTTSRPSTGESPTRWHASGKPKHSSSGSIGRSPATVSTRVSASRRPT